MPQSPTLAPKIRLLTTKAITLVAHVTSQSALLKKGLHVTLVAYGTMLDAKVFPLLVMRNSTVMKSSGIVLSVAILTVLRLSTCMVLIGRTYPISTLPSPAPHPLIQISNRAMLPPLPDLANKTSGNEDP